MARRDDSRYFETEAEARAYAADYLARYAGPWNPYDGRASVSPPNDDRRLWLVNASRNSSAD